MTAVVIDFRVAKERLLCGRGNADERTEADRRKERISDWHVDQLCRVLEDMWPEDGPAVC